MHKKKPLTEKDLLKKNGKKYFASCEKDAPHVFMVTVLMSRVDIFTKGYP